MVPNPESLSPSQRVKAVLLRAKEKRLASEAKGGSNGSKKRATTSQRNQIQSKKAKTEPADVVVQPAKKRLRKLSTQEAIPETTPKASSPPKKRKPRTEKPAKGKGSKQPSEPKPKKGSNMDEKAKTRSRKCCAYKKALNAALAEGSTQEEAKEKAKAVSRLHL